MASKNEDKSQDKETIQDLTQSENEKDLDTELPKRKSTSGKAEAVKEEAFQELQQRYLQLLSIPTKDRSEDEIRECNGLRRKYSKEKGKFPHLVEERQTSTGAERKAKFREKQSDDEKEKVKAYDRERKDTKEYRIANKERMEAARKNLRPYPRKKVPGTWFWWGGGWEATLWEDGTIPKEPPQELEDKSKRLELPYGYLYSPAKSGDEIKFTRKW